MSNFFERQTKTVAIDAENSVTIRKLTHDERQKALSAAFSFQGQGDLVMGNAATQAMLNLSLVFWVGPGFADKPVTSENIGALPAELVDLIVKEVNEFTMLSSAQKKTSSGATNGA